MYLYEKSLTEDMNKLFTNSKVTAVVADSLDEGMRRIASEKEDKITLPVIIYVGGDWELEDVNFYAMMHGTEFRRVDVTDKYKGPDIAKNASVLPITPQYDMHVCAQSSRECDMLTREVLFHYFKNPTLTVKIPYGLNVVHTFNILYGKNIRKAVDKKGLVVRTVPLVLQGAYLWHNDTFNIIKELEATVREEYDLGEMEAYQHQ